MLDKLIALIPKNAAKRAVEALDGFVPVVDGLARSIAKIVDLTPPSYEVVPLMSHHTALGYFGDHRSLAVGAVKGAMVRDRHPKGTLLTQVFLDENDEIVVDDDGRPVGRRVVVERLDELLLELFDGTDLVVVS